MTNDRPMTLTELEAAAAHWQPSPGSQFGRAIAAAIEAGKARDLAFGRLQDLRTALEHKDAAFHEATAAGDATAAAALAAHVTAARQARDEQHAAYRAARERVGELSIDINAMLSELNGARLTCENAQTELNNVRRKHAPRVEVAQALMSAILT